MLRYRPDFKNGPALVRLPGGSGKPSGKEPVQGLDPVHNGRCQLAGMPLPELGGAGVEQTSQRIAPEPAPA